MTLWAGVFLGVGWPAQPAVVEADPASYRALMRTLKPGDTLRLAPGQYIRMPVEKVNGTEAAWITITGPTEGSPAVITTDGAAHNLIELVHSSYIAIENLRIDSRGVPGVFGVSAGGLDGNRVHNIRVEGNTFVGQNGGQQTVAISTLTPTWGWIIRNNRIIGAGTGLYLGQSNGTQPFVAGLIENNLVKDTIGYNMQIKDQIEIPQIPGMPIWPTTTIIRNNVFIKNDQLSPDGDRPNLLVGGFPTSGHGSMNMYEIYGNLFFHNHREALLQASGRVTIHDNLFVDGPYSSPAVILRTQNYPLKIAYFYNNTIYTTGRGVQLGTRALVDDAIVGNLIFALTPISGSPMMVANNVVDSMTNASMYVKAPSFELGSMDFHPLARKCQGPAIDLTPFQSDMHYTLDFNGTPKGQLKGAVVFRGAYATEGDNPGWLLQVAIKPVLPEAGSSAVSLVWVNPAAAPSGSTKQITLTGANFGEGATVELNGADVKVSNVKVASATEITATLTVAANATAGIRDVTVRTASGVSHPIKLRVQAARRGKL